jgi:hypothetical protein
MPSENASSSAKNAARKDLSMFRIFWFVHVLLLGVIWFFGGEKERLVLLAFGALLLLAGAAVLRMRTFCVCGFLGLFACFAVLGWWELPGASVVTRAWIDGLHGKDTAVMLYGSDVEAAHWLRKFRSGEEKAFLRGDGGDAVRFFAARSRTRTFLPESVLPLSSDETSPSGISFPRNVTRPFGKVRRKRGRLFSYFGLFRLPAEWGGDSLRKCRLGDCSGGSGRVFCPVGHLVASGSRIAPSQPG